ncbi:MAG: glycosyltransferase family 4 protein [Candidatus Omnitrophica bacterium]|nr:glycosyltransferase family 4 protein [Candidatus Omnitrophota bacterium]
MLLTDAFGGYGGIAKFNRDFLKSLCSYQAMEEVIAIPRLIQKDRGEIPHKLTYVTKAANSKIRYLFVVLHQILQRNYKKRDMIICGHINLLPLAYLLKKFLKVPVVLIVHGVEAWKSKNKSLITAVDWIISVSEFTRERFSQWSGWSKECITILPNCIELEKFKPGSKNALLLQQYGLENKKTIMTMGRMSRLEQYKGFDEVLAVLSEIIYKKSEVLYMIVGDGDDRLRLEQKAEKLGVQNNVIFTGFIPEEEKADYLRLADVFVMPSRGEGFGIVFLEAMACGAPVVGSKIDGSREALDDGKLGILVDPDERGEIKKAILDLLKEKKVITHSQLQKFSYEQFEKNVQCWLHSSMSQ